MRGGSGGLALLIGAAAVPVVMGSVIALAVRGAGSDGGPVPTATAARAAPPPTAAPRPRPRVYPTHGEYVPPRPVVTVTKRPPTTTKSPTPERTRPSCPPEWRQVPWLKRWCRMHGFEIDDS